MLWYHEGGNCPVSWGKPRVGAQQPQPLTVCPLPPRPRTAETAETAATGGRLSNQHVRLSPDCSSVLTGSHGLLGWPGAVLCWLQTLRWHSTFLLQSSAWRFQSEEWVVFNISPAGDSPPSLPPPPRSPRTITSGIMVGISIGCSVSSGGHKVLSYLAWPVHSK